MKNYLIIIYNSPEAEREWQNMSAEEMQAGLAKYIAYSQRLRDEGRLVAAEGLSLNGSVIRKMGDSIEVINGPYTLAKELVGGFFYITADSLEEATNIAFDCPALDHGSTVEVREQMEYPE